MSQRWTNKRAALRFANRVRAKLGRKPVTRLRRGDIGNSYSCALTNTIGSDIITTTKKVRLRVEGADWTRDQVVAEVPDNVRHFINDFDMGNYPELTF